MSEVYKNGHYYVLYCFIQVVLVIVKDIQKHIFLQGFGKVQGEALRTTIRVVLNNMTRIGSRFVTLWKNHFGGLGRRPRRQPPQTILLNTVHLVVCFGD